MLSVEVASTTLLVEQQQSAVITQAQAQPTLLVSGVQGPIGPQGPPGSAVEGDFLQVLNYLGEFATQQQKTNARENLELNYIDCGEFF